MPAHRIRQEEVMKMRIKKLVVKYFIIIVLFPLTVFSQTQLGNDILGQADEYLGYSVSMSGNGNFVAVGAPINSDNTPFAGQVRVYQYISNAWVQVGNDINGEGTNNFSGEAISFNEDGTILAIGADGNSDNGTNSGHVRIYTNTNGMWTQLGNDIDGKFTGDLFGYSVELSSDGLKVAIGATLGEGNGVDTGYASVYEYDGASWVQVGDDISGINSGEQCGYSVALNSDGSVLAVSSVLANGNVPDSGIVRVFEYDGSSWVPKGSVLSGQAAFDYFGNAISLNSDGTILAVGADSVDLNGSNFGQVKVYQFINNDWLQIGSELNGDDAVSNFGFSVSLNAQGNLLGVGANRGKDSNGDSTGLARLYSFENGEWIQLGNTLFGATNLENFGRSVSLSGNGNKLAIGVPFSNLNGTQAGLAQVYDLSSLLSVNSFTSSQVKIFPNPVQHSFRMNLDQGVVLNSVHIYNLLGHKLKTSTSNIVDIGGLSSGIYIVEIETNQGKLTKRLIKE